MMLFTRSLKETTVPRFDISLWLGENPHGMRAHAAQHRFSMNVWTSMIGDLFFFYYFLPAPTTSIEYRIFLQEMQTSILHKRAYTFTLCHSMSDVLCVFNMVECHPSMEHVSVNIWIKCLVTDFSVMDLFPVTPCYPDLSCIGFFILSSL